MIDIPNTRIHLHRDLVSRGGLREFIRLAWPIVEPERKFLSNWHLDAIADHLQAVSRKQIKDLIINMPPTMGKSRMVSVLWPAWEWIENPGTKFIYASYDLGLPKRDGELALNLMCSQWFRDRWGDIVERDQPVLNYESRRGGMRYGTSVLGKVTGNHGDIRVVDDPIKPLEVSRKNLERCQLWWDGTMSSRIADPETARSVIMMQRLADNDLAGYLADKGGYEVLRLPMRYEARNPCVTVLGSVDPRKEEGELLFPARAGEEVVKKLERTLGPTAASAQLQQDPAPVGGNIFEQKWVEHTYSKLPESFDQMWQSWDMTFKGEEESDYVCGGVWVRKDLNYFLVKVILRRLSFTETLSNVRLVCDEFPEALVKLVENKANGPAVVSALETEIPGWELLEPEGGKVARANGCTPLFRAGQVWFPESAEMYVNTSLIEVQKQLVRFPKAANDDFVDMTSQALNWGRKNQSNLTAAMEILRKRGMT